MFTPALNENFARLEGPFANPNNGHENVKLSQSASDFLCAAESSSFFTLYKQR